MDATLELGGRVKTIAFQGRQIDFSRDPCDLLTCKFH
jgi:hypothetical protein